MLKEDVVPALMDPAIFRAYDIRGVAGESLTEDVVRLIGCALGSAVLAAGEDLMVTGRDGRLSGPTLLQALQEGILSTGCNVLDIGLVPTPLVYYATAMLATHSGVMLTGSHNPANYNGLKMVIAGKTLSDDGITQLRETIDAGKFRQGAGEYFTEDFSERYLRHILSDIQLARPLKVVVDSGNGAAGQLAPQLYQAMGCEVIPLFCEIDGRFPNHHPDPGDPKNLQDLIKKVKETDADVGLAFDGDGDRLGVVTSDGEIIWPDRLLMLYAKQVLAELKGATIIYDVKCTRHLEKLIQENGGVPMMGKTGHSLIKARLAETRGALAGEMSGHFFFKDRWYGFDDGLYAGARLLEILANHPDKTAKSAALFADIPDSVNTPELKIPVADNEKFAFMEKLVAHADFSQDATVGPATISTIDGLRVNFANGWGLVRPSNTTPCLVLRFEAESEKILADIQAVFRDCLLAINPNLVLPF